MSTTTEERADAELVDRLRRVTESGSLVQAPSREEVLPAGMSVDRAWGLFDAQVTSRTLDYAARWMQARGRGYYTIGSAGHEGNAALADVARPTDPALLHYRSCAFFVRRAAQAGEKDAIRDVLLGVAAAANDPVSGGRHKVIGSATLSIIPQTSTIASHLPRAVGVAFSAARARKLGVPYAWPDDAVTICSFGDASANHSTAVGAVNAAVHASYQGFPMPLLFVCEDNGLGISVRTPPGWIAHAYGSRPGLRYVDVDGCRLVDAWTAAREALAWVRDNRKPAFLRMRAVRLMGHAGSDVETAYRRPADIASELEQDPILGTARTLVAAGCATGAEVLQRYDHIRAEVFDIAAEVMGEPPITDASKVVEPIALGRLNKSSASSVVTQPRIDRRDLSEPVTLAQAINRALLDILEELPNAMVFGEDVAAKGGVYGVTRGLARRAGAARVFDTLLDEQTILGLALGAGVSGLLPIPEIQYLAYVHNAEDQIRGEGATLPFFSNGQYRNPMIVRVAGYGYQKGFGGHFHNDNSVAVLRDIPGLVIASPSRPDDAAMMLRACARLAADQGRLCVFVEPIALYHTRDLYSDGDGGWLSQYPLADRTDDDTVGRARVYGSGSDLTLVSFANGVPMSLRAAARLAERGVKVRVVDLRWLAPLPMADLVRAATATGRVLLVDETRRTGGVSEGIVAALTDAGWRGRLGRLTSEDSYIPLGDAAHHVLLGEDEIVEASLQMVQ